MHRAGQGQGQGQARAPRWQDGVDGGLHAGGSRGATGVAGEPSVIGGRGRLPRAWGGVSSGRHRLTGDQVKVMRAIETCRTAVLGGHVDVCPTAGLQTPVLQLLPQPPLPQVPGARSRREWIEERKAAHPARPTTSTSSSRSPRAASRWRRRTRRSSTQLLFARREPARCSSWARTPRARRDRSASPTVLHTWTRTLELPPARPLHRHRRRA